jgi:hypothetical protein
MIIKISPRYQSWRIGEPANQTARSAPQNPASVKLNPRIAPGTESPLVPSADVNSAIDIIGDRHLMPRYKRYYLWELDESRCGDETALFRFYC